MPKNEPLGAIDFPFLLSIEIFSFSNDLLFKNINMSIKENLLLQMAHFLASICPHFVKNAAWCALTCQKKMMRGSVNLLVLVIITGTDMLPLVTLQPPGR